MTTYKAVPSCTASLTDSTCLSTMCMLVSCLLWHGLSTMCKLVSCLLWHGKWSRSGDSHPCNCNIGQQYNCVLVYFCVLHCSRWIVCCVEKRNMCRLKMTSLVKKKLQLMAQKQSLTARSNRLLLRLSSSICATYAHVLASSGT